VAISRGLNGIGLAIVTPAILSLVADSTNDSNRGMAFGWLQLTATLGSIIGGLCSVLIASTTIMGIPGWRVAFHLVAIISVLVGILVRLFAHDPQFSDKKSRQSNSTRSFMSEMKELLMEAKSTLFTVAISIGGLFGGKMGDILAKQFPNSGRIILSQISSGSAIPLAAFLLLVLPDDPSTGFMHGLVLFVMGLSISWNGPATNNPIFAEIVPEKSRTSIYALDRSFESILASFAPPVVGILAQHVYGYQVPKRSSESIQQVETDRENAASLAKALYSAICIPMLLCCSIYSFLYCTYPRDRERAKMTAVIESELQRMDDDDEEQSSQLNMYVSEEDGLTISLGDSDDKALLSSADQLSKLDHR
ncbi:hypothetical protein LINPERPRIM_LOCUS37999, partial [Linum perenne]